MTFAKADRFREAIRKLDELYAIAEADAYEPGSWPLIILARLRRRLEDRLEEIESGLLAPARPGGARPGTSDCHMGL